MTADAVYATPIADGIKSVTPSALSADVREKLARVRPITLGQAARFPGLTAAAMSLLLIHPKRRRSNRPGAPASRERRRLAGTGFPGVSPGRWTLADT